MALYHGAHVLLKIKSLEENKFRTVGGMRTTRMTLNQQVVDATSQSSQGWRELLDKGGVSSISISGQGVFTNSGAEENVRRAAFQAALEEFECCFGNGMQVEGKFLVSSYERLGGYKDEETYALTLESSGPVRVTFKELEG